MENITESEQITTEVSENEDTSFSDESEPEEFIGLKKGYIYTNGSIEFFSIVLTVYELYFVILLYFMLVSFMV
jgi:hypothetical protein